MKQQKILIISMDHHFQIFIKVLQKNRNILFDIDWKGAQKLRNKFDKNQILDFFILPPNKKELKRRLEKRGRDNKKEIKTRLIICFIRNESSC